MHIFLFLLINCDLNNFLMIWLLNMLIDWLIDWFVDWLTDLLVNFLLIDFQVWSVVNLFWGQLCQSLAVSTQGNIWISNALVCSVANGNIQKCCTLVWSVDIENRIYREEFTRKKCKTAIYLYCFHTAGVLHIFMLYHLLGPGKSKIIVKRKPNYEIGWFHNWPMIILHRLYAFHFTKL